QGIADHVAKRAAALHPLAYAGCFRGRLRMDENEGLQFLGLGPERVELARRYFLALDAAADSGPGQTKTFYAEFKLLGRKLGKLQRDRRIGHEASRRGLAHLRELLALQVEDTARQVAVGAVPEWIDAHHLHIDAVLVHVGDALAPHWKSETAVELPTGGCL